MKNIWVFILGWAASFIFTIIGLLSFQGYTLADLKNIGIDLLGRLGVELLWVIPIMVLCLVVLIIVWFILELQKLKIVRKQHGKNR